MSKEDMTLICEFDSEEDCSPEENCHHWQDMLEELKVLMNKVNEGNEWVARVENFGWRKTTGVKIFDTKHPEELLRSVLPKTNNTFKIYFREHRYPKTKDKIKEIVIQNWHHDSPTGDEHYYITKMLL